MEKRVYYSLAVVFLSLHIGLAIHASQNLSPPWDEINYPASGYTQLKTGQLNLITYAPFLSRIIYGMPLLFLNPSMPLDHNSWRIKESFQYGFHFIFRNQIPFNKLIFWSRIPAILISFLLGVLIFILSAHLWGPKGGMISLLCFLATPILVSRGHLALLEMPMYLFMALTLYLNILWSQSGRIQWLVGSGISTGITLVCKLTSLPFFAALLILNGFVFPKIFSLKKKLGCAALYGGISIIVVFLIYLPWSGGIEGLRQLIQAPFIFNISIPYFWSGNLYENSNPFLSLAAFLIKAPPFILILGAWGGILWLKLTEKKVEGIHLGILSGFYLLCAIPTGNAVSTIQMSPFYLGWVGLAGSLGTIEYSKKWKQGIFLILALAISFYDLIRVHPNYLAYFNFLVGGSQNGHKYLSDSDQDWGQSLPALSRYIKGKNNPNVILCYSGPSDPEAYGIYYRDLISPALVTRETRKIPLWQKDKPTLLAVGTKVVQSEPALMNWLIENQKPVDMVSFSFLVFDISTNSEIYKWMGHVYLKTHRPDQALWAFEMAGQLKPGQKETQEMIKNIREKIS